jgi:enoyl-CoA hydratase/carnithine racemase
MDNSPSLSDRVTIEIADGVAEVTLNRPDKLNALDPAMFEAIIAAGERLGRTPGLRAVVLAGAGKGFCAGLDKQTFAFLAAKDAAALGDLTKRTHGIANAFQQAAYVWRTLPVPVIAAIHAGRRLSDRPWRRHPLCRAGCAPRDTGNQMGHRARHGRNRAYA